MQVPELPLRALLRAREDAADELAIVPASQDLVPVKPRRSGSNKEPLGTRKRGYDEADTDTRPLKRVMTEFVHDGLIHRVLQ